ARRRADVGPGRACTAPTPDCDRARRHARCDRRVHRHGRPELLGDATVIAAPPSTLSPGGSEAHHLATVWWIIFALAADVCLVVGGFIVGSSLRGRRRAPLEGPSRHDDYFIWIGGVIAPVLILIFVAFLTVHTGAALRNPSKNALPVHVVGKQWWWAVSY